MSRILNNLGQKTKKAAPDDGNKPLQVSPGLDAGGVANAGANPTASTQTADQGSGGLAGLSKYLGGNKAKIENFAGGLAQKTNEMAANAGKPLNDVRNQINQTSAPTVASASQLSTGGINADQLKSTLQGAANYKGPTDAQANEAAAASKNAIGKAQSVADGLVQGGAQRIGAIGELNGKQYVGQQGSLVNFLLGRTSGANQAFAGAQSAVNAQRDAINKGADSVGGDITAAQGKLNAAADQQKAAIQEAAKARGQQADAAIKSAQQVAGDAKTTQARQSTLALSPQEQLAQMLKLDTTGNVQKAINAYGKDTVLNNLAKYAPLTTSVDRNSFSADELYQTDASLKSQLDAVNALRGLLGEQGISIGGAGATPVVGLDNKAVDRLYNQLGQDAKAAELAKKQAEELDYLKSLQQMYPGEKINMPTPTPLTPAQQIAQQQDTKVMGKFDQGIAGGQVAAAQIPDIKKQIIANNKNNKVR